MASRRNRDDRPTMIHCEYCGEDYASTYKHCPFCDEMPLEDEDYDGDEDSVRRPRGGKRLVTNTRGGGYGRGPSPLRLIGIIISLAVIIAAIIIVISVIIPLVTKGNSANDPGTVESVMPTDSAQPSADPDPTESVEPVETIPADQTATDFSLSLTEFSLSNRYPDPVTLKVTFSPEGSTGTITWSSSDPDIVSDFYAALGDLLFASVNLSRHLGADPEITLHRACEKFAARFRKVEKSVEESGRPWKDFTLDELEEFWQKAKNQ